MQAKQIFNFSAGPALLPAPVLRQAQVELLDYQGTGMSIMEVSHRSAIFQGVIDRAEASLRTLMEIPDHYEVLFLQGGATTQFAMVPLNLFRSSKQADLLDTGAWSAKAFQEASRYGTVTLVGSSKDQQYQYIPDLTTLPLNPAADYVHITTNNTIFGTRLPQIPETGTVPLVADMSSNILAETYRMEDFGLIYAGAQKNIGPSGLTIVIVRKDLIGQALPETPLMLNYQTHADKGSLFNTPPTFAIYLAGLVFEWMLAEGGVPAFERRNAAKAATLYAFLDQSERFNALVAPPYRSRMNVCFHTGDPALDQQVVKAAEEAGFQFLKGHRSVGGLRASLYNAMDLAGVESLVSFLKAYEKGLAV